MLRHASQTLWVMQNMHDKSRNLPDILAVDRAAAETNHVETKDVAGVSGKNRRTLLKLHTTVQNFRPSPSFVMQNPECSRCLMALFAWQLPEAEAVLH